MADNKCECKPLVKRIFAAVYNLILIILLIVALIFVLDRINNRVTFIFDNAVVIIATGSMEPEIPARSCILIEKTNPEDVRIGDVITFYSDDPAIKNSLNTHRVEGIIEHANGFEFRTKGDNNTLVDVHTAKGDRLVGRYVRILPLITAIAALLMGRYGMFIIIAFFVLYAMLMTLPGAMRRKKRKNAEHKAEYERRLAEEIEQLRKNDASVLPLESDGGSNTENIRGDTGGKKQ